MNDNLRMLLDQLTVAPTEMKSEIIHIMVSEGCFPAVTFGAGLALTLLRVTCKLGGNAKVRSVLMKKNSDQIDTMFFSLLDEITMKESLPLIQDLLYAAYLSKWEFHPDHAKKYIEKNLINAAYSTEI